MTMKLPVPKFPIYETILPSNNKKIKYRPFVMAEEKVLLMAYETDKAEEIITAIRSIIQSCLVTDGIDVEKLSAFDMEWLFLKLRMVSVGEMQEVGLKNIDAASCEQCWKKKFDGTKEQVVTKVMVDLKEAKVVFPEGFKKLFDLGNGFGLTMTFPTNELLNKITIDAENGSLTRTMFDIIATCVDTMFQGDDVFKASDYTLQDVTDWLMHFPRSKLEMVTEEFFGKMPNVAMDIKWQCGVCGKDLVTPIKGIIDFFV